MQCLKGLLLDVEFDKTATSHPKLRAEALGHQVTRPPEPPQALVSSSPPDDQRLGILPRCSRSDKLPIAIVRLQ